MAQTESVRDGIAGDVSPKAPVKRRRGNGSEPKIKRNYCVGAELFGGGTHFRVWAPDAKKVEALIELGPGAPAITALRAEEDGYHAGFVEGASAGTRYRFRLNGEQSRVFSDPASRFQPDGPFGSSEVIDPKFAWTDSQWTGVELEGQVIYEMHIGTFTKEGKWNFAAQQLEELAKVGITLIEVMPVADFPGRFGWGYDGVNLWAPTWLYGSPVQFREFVNTAHAHGLGVILDVVYNHLGPDGNHLREFAASYFTDRYQTDWGAALNFDGERSKPVRDYITANASYWIREFHLDGLRLDATQNVYDSTDPHILADITTAVRKAARGRSTLVVAENEPQDTKLLRAPSKGGYGMDALWNDDFHHSAIVALTGRNEAYYTDHLGAAQEFVSAIKHGFLYQGQWYSWQRAPRGTPAFDVGLSSFIAFIQNHDQVANSAWGKRIHQITSPGRYRAMTALALLAPQTPMLFQGQEFAASAPFRYFSDHKPEISKLVMQGRGEFLAQFRSLRDVETQAMLADPGNPATFEGSKLDFADRERNSGVYLLHKELLRLRREDPVIRLQGKAGIDGAVLSGHAFVLRFFGIDGDDRLLLVNFQTDLQQRVSPEPLLAPPLGKVWKVLLSTEDPRFGGLGVYIPNADGPWIVPGETAVLLGPAEAEMETQPASAASTTGAGNEKKNGSG